MTDTIIDNMIQIKLTNDDSFLKIIETLSRIGIASKKEKKLTQTAHILQKKKNYYIVHFKEMFLMDGRESDISEEDIQRRNLIALLLEEWGLCTIVKPSIEDLEDNCADPRRIKILKHSEKGDWTLVQKYRLGKKKSN